MGRSGCVATTMSVIERVKIEQTVDVFQAIKLIRAKRPSAVDTLVGCLLVSKKQLCMESYSHVICYTCINNYSVF